MTESSSLPSLNDLFSVSESVGASFRDNGWALLRAVCSPQEAASYGQLIREVAIANSNETRPMEERDTYGKAFLQITNLWRIDERVAAFTLSKRFAGIAAQLLGGQHVRIYHDQALFKEPGGGHTPWHQDGYFWPLDHSKTVTMWMPLVDVPPEMGTMSFADRSHIEGIVSLDEGISDSSEAYYEKYIEDQGYSVTTSGAMRAGDATFHTGLTLHKAPNNPTQTVREVMTIIYFADGLKIEEPKNANQGLDLETWFPGASAGDLAATELNPRL
jgi:ectoine hydroxylase-related dioxygenase (phytanoyl-CoA dioxygenase family)